ncbi:hypothetical protein ACJJIK_09450 [Microbulbifer sp. ZKSA006]
MVIYKAAYDWYLNHQKLPEVVRETSKASDDTYGSCRVKIH